MSTEEDKYHHSWRRHKDQVAIEKQLKIAKSHSNFVSKWKAVDQPHRNSKSHIMDCGHTNCFLCGNPRRVSNEETFQERKFKQKKLYDDTGFDEGPL